MKRLDSPAWPSLIYLHGLVSIMLLGLVIGLGRIKGYAMMSSGIATVWLMLVIRNRWSIACFRKSFQACDWVFIAFVTLILSSFAMQGWDKAWVMANARLVPFMVIAPYLCGRLMAAQDLVAYRTGMVVLLCLLIPVFVLALFFVDSSTVSFYRPIINGTDEITARISLLVAQVTVVVAFFLLNGMREKFHWGYIAAYSFLILVLSFLGLRSVVLIVLCVLFVAIFKAEWIPKARRVGVVILMLAAFFASYVAVSRAYHMADLKGDEFVQEALKAAAPEPAETKAPPSDEKDPCLQNQIKQNSIAIRLELLRDGWQQFKASPAFGAGAGAFGLSSCWHDSLAHPHNIVMHVLSELGLVGCCLLIVLLGLVAIPALRASWSPQGIPSLAFLLFLFGLLNAIMGGNYFTASDLWLGLGLLAAESCRPINQESVVAAQA